MSPWGLLAASIVLLLALHLPRRFESDAEVRGPLLTLLWGIVRAYAAFWHRLSLPTGMAPLPVRGPAILIANHTCGIDNFLLQAACPRLLGFMIVHDWYDYPLCRPFCRLLRCIPVQRDGRDLSATRAALRALEEGRVVPIFPEGRILPRSGHEFGEPQPGAAYLALRSGAPVYPAYICGTPPTSDIFRALRTPSRARVVFGPAVDLSAFPVGNGRPEKAVLEDVTNALMSAIRALKDQYPPDWDQAEKLPPKVLTLADSGGAGHAGGGWGRSPRGWRSPRNRPPPPLATPR